VFRDDDNRPIAKSTTINVLIAHGGLGDLICTIPALNQLVTTQHWINPLIWVPDYMLEFTKHFLPKGTIIRDYTQAKKKFDDTLIGVSTKWLPQRTAMRTHPVDYAYQCLLDKVPYDQNERSYPRIRASEINLDKFQLPTKYVVIVATAAEVVKTMPEDTMNQIIDHVKAKGYEVIFVGQEKIDNGLGVRDIPKPLINLDKGLNLVNKTSLLELAAVMDGSALVIGMDGGPIHIAGFTAAKIVCGYTFASPDHLMPIREGVPGWDVYPVTPDSDLKCSFCQTNWSLMYGHDFRSCYYGPNDYSCVKMMTFDKFKVEIDKVLCEPV